MRTRLAVFDCDGTLVDSQHNICTAMARCFEREGRTPPTREAILRVVGLSLPDVMRVLLPDGSETFQKHMVDQYRLTFQALRAAGLPEEPLYDGMAETLAALDAEGWMLAVATGKSHRGLALCLAAHGIAGLFVSLQTADRNPSKPHPAMLEAAMADAGAARRDTVMIGDTRFDMAMAKAAGVRAVGVGWGYHPEHELIDEGADAVAQSAQELPRILRTL